MRPRGQDAEDEPGRKVSEAATVLGKGRLQVLTYLELREEK